MTSLENMKAEIRRLEAKEQVNADMSARNIEKQKLAAKLWALKHPKLNKARNYAIGSSQKIMKAAQKAIVKAKKMDSRKPRRTRRSNGGNIIGGGFNFNPNFKFRPPGF